MKHICELVNAGRQIELYLAVYDVVIEKDRSTSVTHVVGDE
jgi:hypothetical protein